MDVRTTAGDVVPVLEGYGPRLTDGLPTAWHVEHHRSEEYAIAALLILTPEEDPEVEIAVVAVQLRTNPRVEWEVDVIGRDAALLAEIGPLTDLQHRTMAENPSVAADMLRGFLEAVVEPVRDMIRSDLM